ncbi:MAG: hypothetical protein K9H84_05865 [Bacteroidales bacterium]|nr:hypothetical protein [Bacteroidales bacterium]
MRKFINIAVFLLLFPAMLGFTINQHYCKGKLVVVETYFFSFLNDHNHNCCEAVKTCQSESSTCETQNDKKSCPNCHEEKQNVKITDLFLMANNIYDIPDYSLDINSQGVLLQNAYFYLFTGHITAGNAPPVEYYRDLSFLMRYLL